MKKLVTILCFVFVLVPAQKLFAQKFSLGPGVLLHSILVHEGNVIDMKSAPGLSLDFEVAFPVAPTFMISTGASFTGLAGYHFGGDTSLNLGEIFFDVPVRGRVCIDLGPNVVLQFIGGPVMSVNLVSIDAHASHTNNNYETYPELRRFDVLVGFGVGVELIKHIRITTGFDYGVLDRNGSSDAWMHRGQSKFGVQYIF